MRVRKGGALFSERTAYRDSGRGWMDVPVVLVAVAPVVVELHGGTLDLESEPGAGTTVTVTLPAVPQMVGAMDSAA